MFWTFEWIFIPVAHLGIFSGWKLRVATVTDKYQISSCWTLGACISTWEYTGNIP